MCIRGHIGEEKAVLVFVKSLKSRMNFSLFFPDFVTEWPVHALFINFRLRLCSTGNNMNCRQVFVNLFDLSILF